MAKTPKVMPQKPDYEAIIEKIFFDNYTNGTTEFGFGRQEIETAANFIGIKVPKILET